jgi:ankyrin repeat protein
MSLTVKGLSAWTIVVLLSLCNLAAASDPRLADAAKQGDRDAVRSLLKQKVDVNSAQADGATAVAWAAYRDDLETADLLIASGANVNTANDYGITPLLLACNNGSAAMVDKLLKAQANPNAASDWTGETPLMACASTGNGNAVKSLLFHEANVNAADARQGHTALMRAVARRHADVARALLEGGADVNAHAKSGFTALMFAAQQGDMDLAKALVKAGADVDAATNAQGLWEGDTALLLASLSGHEALSIFLLENGANPNAADENGLTALHFTLMNGLARICRIQMRSYTSYLARPNMVGLLKALLAHGANPNAQVKSALAGNKFYKGEGSQYRPYEPLLGTVSPVGATAFLMAAISYDSDVMRILATGGADPRLGTEENVTPLMVAAGLGRQRFTPLSADEEKRALEAVQLAVQLGADVNRTDNISGLTALHGAAFSGSNTIIPFLVEKGAYVDAKDKEGHTPLDIAYAAQASVGGAGNNFPELRWVAAADLLLKLGATPVNPPAMENRTCGELCAELGLGKTPPVPPRRER